ncbi:aminotransferase class I/II-fold pyridoxal phosphate-dependent enzyme [Telmatospirillum siberiense]|uniref:Aspartate aminotransferase n=1 Tax=Telmatospirillum siberiense TaxID=382514 RepID=A0A2N3PN23_9PROT|nr:aminotransferase class I/II-fold pyridoxal phosphate-dependent enzyme [Telmatospirillum siberiense]PKU21794.1 aspartate aminotransferase [Telmatospirillum siberiense]
MTNPRLDLLTDYPFQRLATLLQGPPGADPIIMSIGEPQHQPPAWVSDILTEQVAGWGKYPPMAGTQAFRAAAAAWLTRRFRLPDGAIDGDRQILPLSGTREGLFQIAHLVCDPAKSAKPPVVLLPNPFYQVYAGAALLAGAEPVFVPAGPENGFLPDFTALPKALLDRTALAYLCNPANPQGTVADAAYLEAAVSLARRHGFTLAVDECYSEIYDGTEPAGALQACAKLGGGMEGVVIFHSLSKRSSAPGLRSGFVAGEAGLIKDFGRLRAYGGAAVPLPILAASTALWQEETHVEANRSLYRAKLDVAEEIFGKRLGFYRPAGGFFLWLDVGDGERAASRLWTDAGVRVLPGAYLARPDEGGRNPGAPFIRVALVHDLETTRRALSRIADVLVEA